MGLNLGPEGREINTVNVGLAQLAVVAPEQDQFPTPVTGIISPVVGGNVWGTILHDRRLHIAALSIPKSGGDLKPSVSALIKMFNDLGSKKVELIVVSGSDLLQEPHRQFREQIMEGVLDLLEQKGPKVAGRDWQEVQTEQGIFVDSRNGLTFVSLNKESKDKSAEWLHQQRMIAIINSLVRRPNTRTIHPVNWAYRPLIKAA